MSESLQQLRVSGHAIVARRPRWSEWRLIAIVVSVAVGGFAALSWWFGALGGFVLVQVCALLISMLGMNLLPFIGELATGQFDPFDVKYLFLIWFFFVFTLASYSELIFGFSVKPEMAALYPSDSDEVRALSSIVLGLSAFVAGSYMRIGDRLANFLPRVSGVSRSRAIWIGSLCCGVGAFAFWGLIVSAGGLSSFLENLATWRTVGLLKGVGYLVFPATVLLPSAAILMLLPQIPDRGRRLTVGSLFFTGTVVLSWTPILLIGFRISLVPAMLQLLAAWHYQRRRLRLGVMLALGVSIFLALSLYGAVRDAVGETIGSQEVLETIIYRTSGIDTVERVVQQMGRGEPKRGLLPGFIESASILIPRALWPQKPPTEGLAFDDIFFFDIYLRRGASINGITSGISTTLIGEELWTDGIFMVMAGSLILGILARVAVVWRDRGGILHIFIYILFMGNFFIFVEAPQNALNNSVMLAAMGMVLLIALTFKGNISANCLDKG